MTHTDCWMFMIYVFIKTQDNRGRRASSRYDRYRYDPGCNTKIF